MNSSEIDILKALDRHQVPYLIIGGHAVYAHGFRRETEDVDIVWLRSPGAEAAMERALTEVEAAYLSKEINPATGIEKAIPISASYIQANHLMMLWTRHGFLDVFDYIPGHPGTSVTELFATAIEVEGRKFPSLDWLRRMKEAAGRAKDRNDLDNLPQP